MSIGGIRPENIMIGEGLVVIALDLAGALGEVSLFLLKPHIATVPTNRV